MNNRIVEIDKELESLNAILKDATKRIDAETIQITLDKMTALNKEKVEIEKNSRVRKVMPAKNAPIGNSNITNSRRGKSRKEFNISDYNNSTKIDGTVSL